MFRCAVTGKMSAPGEKTNKLVLETREKVYYGPVLDEETGYFEEVEIGRGFEIVKEVDATDEGVRVWMSLQKAGL